MFWQKQIVSTNYVLRTLSWRKKVERTLQKLEYKVVTGSKYRITQLSHVLRLCWLLLSVLHCVVTLCIVTSLSVHTGIWIVLSSVSIVIRRSSYTDNHKVMDTCTWMWWCYATQTRIDKCVMQSAVFGSVSALCRKLNFHLMTATFPSFDNIFLSNTFISKEIWVGGWGEKLL